MKKRAITFSLIIIAIGLVVGLVFWYWNKNEDEISFEREGHETADSLSELKTEEFNEEVELEEVIAPEIEEEGDKIDQKENVEQKDKVDEKKVDFEELEERWKVEKFEYSKKMKSYHGGFIAKGYVTLHERQQGFCMEDCPKHTYAFFNVVEISNKNVADYINETEGNSFFGKNSLGIGCLEKDVLWHINSSNDFGYQEHRTSVEDSQKILKATAENPIMLIFQKYPLSEGAGAPDCYSHFSKYSILE